MATYSCIGWSIVICQPVFLKWYLTGLNFICNLIHNSFCSDLLSTNCIFLVRTFLSQSQHCVTAFSGHLPGMDKGSYFFLHSRYFNHLPSSSWHFTLAEHVNIFKYLLCFSLISVWIALVHMFEPAGWNSPQLVCCWITSESSHSRPSSNAFEYRGQSLEVKVLLNGRICCVFSMWFQADSHSFSSYWRLRVQ